MTISSRDKDTKKINRTKIIIIVKSKRKRPNDLTITSNQNQKPSNSSENEKSKKDTSVADKVSPLNNQDPKSESLESKKVFSDDEIFNPTIVNGQCYTRRPYL